MMDKRCSSSTATAAARELARTQMSLVNDIHRVHLAIVCGVDDMHVLQFEAADCARIIERTIPTLTRDTRATSVIMSSPATRTARDAAVVAILERNIETFYVPIVRIFNAEHLIGDFRPATAIDTNAFGPIFEALVANWIERDIPLG